MVAMSQVDVPQMQFVEVPVGVIPSRTQLNFTDARKAVSSVVTVVGIIAGVLSFAYVAGGNGDILYSFSKFIGFMIFFAAGTLFAITLMRAGARWVFDRVKARNLSYVEERAAALRNALSNANWSADESAAFSLIVHRQGALEDENGWKFQAYGAAFTKDHMTVTVALKDEVLLAEQRAVSVAFQAEYAVSTFEDRNSVTFSDSERQAFMNGFIHRANLFSGSEVR